MTPSFSILWTRLQKFWNTSESLQRSIFLSATYIFKVFWEANWPIYRFCFIINFSWSVKIVVCHLDSELSSICILTELLLAVLLAAYLRVQIFQFFYSFEQFTVDENSLILVCSKDNIFRFSFLIATATAIKSTHPFFNSLTQGSLNFFLQGPQW